MFLSERQDLPFYGQCLRFLGMFSTVNGGLISTPSQGYFAGIFPSLSNAVLVIAGICCLGPVVYIYLE